MIQMKGKTYMCSACGWKHDEVDAVASLGPLLDGFTDPEAMRRIMGAQSVERVTAALVRHEKECPKRNAVSEEAKHE